LTAALVDAGDQVDGAFVYIPSGTGAHTVPVQVILSGDDNARLRALAKEASRRLSSAPGVTQVVMNFKEPSRQLALTFDHAKTIRAGVSPAEAASALRWNLYGPVALKWIDGDRERDLRIKGPRGRALTRDELVNLPIVGTQGTVKVSSLARLTEEPGGAKIYHENRQRVVYLTAQTTQGSAREIVRSLTDALGQVAWPPGYTFRIDPRLAEQEAHFGWVAVSLALSLVLVGLLLGARSQSFAVPPLTLAMVPVALAFPVLGAALMGGFTVPVLLGLVLLSGTIVNNAILIVDAVRQRSGSVYRVLRRRWAPLAMTNLTAVLGSLPLIFAGEPGSILPTLAVLVVWGALGASLTTLTTIPALLTKYPGALKPVTIDSGGLP
jgi:HAE1 family hydrophobic/amphiphilic exporter-1